jgi:hypothetical protein
MIWLKHLGCWWLSKHKVNICISFVCSPYFILWKVTWYLINVYNYYVLIHF